MQYNFITLIIRMLRTVSFYGNDCLSIIPSIVPEKMEQS